MKKLCFANVTRWSGKKERNTFYIKWGKTMRHSWKALGWTIQSHKWKT